MNAFYDARLTESRSLIKLKPFLDAQSDGRYVLNSKGPLAMALQERIGDAFFNCKNGELWSVEMKAEEEDRYGNIYIEMWSNLNLGDEKSFLERGSNPGWFLKSTARLLLYHFLKTDDLYVVRMFRLRQYLDVPGEDGHPLFENYPLKVQGKRTQRNDTWGRCIPIDVLMRECGMRKFNVRQLFMFEEAPITS